LNAGFFGRLQHREPARPIIIARRFFDEVPAKTVAKGSEAQLSATAIVLKCVPVMSRGPDEVEPHPVPPPMRRAFEPGHEEAVEVLGPHLFLRRASMLAALFFRYNGCKAIERSIRKNAR
jgi:hypothetical protein